MAALLQEALQPLRKVPLGLSAALLGSMAAPHCLYAYIWQRPCDFLEGAARMPLRLLGEHAVEVMQKLVLGLKAIQLASLLAWCEFGLLPVCGAVSGPSRWLVVQAIRSAAPARWILGLGLLLPGQALNVGVYRSIGADGVYYGVKLGRPVPWASGFPFNVGLRHPQYVGAMCSWAGLCALLAATPSAAAPLGAVLLLWGGFYTASAVHEASSDADVVDK
uniref:phosphatidyl-N-methylethanolamine N-methyltransferase n=1 Tax=Alexandrium catenella TaxID=2925 RepID=A0A7S1RWR3_ALECA|mmetsp:Transcript_76210/g.202374  ORF Transcript_76210/g.202374 Transcript_76210/m.202374 type:complete len:220 (+) Transcript_76210:71-730(+)